MNFLHKGIAYLLGSLLCVGGGCQKDADCHLTWQKLKGVSDASQAPLLTIRFEEGKPLRYQMVSERTVEIRLTGDAASERSAPQKISEKLEIVLRLTPQKADPFGLSSIVAVCESAKVTRTSFSGKDGVGDAVESLVKFPYHFAVSPLGQIEPSESFNQMISHLGQQAFSSGRTDSSSIKNPDMINDFLALHQSLWLAAASQPDPAEGIAEGKQWMALQIIPWPLPIIPTPTRQTNWSVLKIAKTEQGHIATIKSVYSLSPKSLENIPMPYQGPFQMRGLFGFLRNYQFEMITGEGQQIYDLNAGQMVSDYQHYQMKVLADFALPLGNSKPVLSVEQTLSIQRIDDGLRTN